jgi:stress-induced-phosphoprotein 1
MKESMNRQGGAPDKETLERAMRNPEIQEILSDPVMRQILEDMQSDPKAAQEYDFLFFKKINI